MKPYNVQFFILFFLCRVARDKGSDTGADEEGSSPFWWCDPGQAGYGFFLVPGIKTWCQENDA